MIRTIQSIGSPPLDTFFRFLTGLHSETLYMLVLPVIFWLYDKRFARYVASLFFLGYWANGALKDLFHTARPSPAYVKVIAAETGLDPAFPSGHAQNPLMFWGALAMQIKRSWFTWSAVALVLLIGLSRLYLGLHWPLDVLGGWAIGAVMLYGFWRTKRFWAGEGISFGAQLLGAVAIPLITSFVWHGDLVFIGAYLGIWVGSVLEERFVGFDPRDGGIRAQLLKLVVGFALLLAIKEGLKPFVPGFVRYALIGLFATWGAPWLFRRLRSTTPIDRSLTR